EETTAAYTLEASMMNQDSREELSVGDEVWANVKVKDSNGEYLVYQEQWDFVPDAVLNEMGYSLCAYYDESVEGKEGYNNGIRFDGNVPEEAFGKYVYYLNMAQVFIDEETSDYAAGVAVSRYPVTSYCGTKHTTFMANGSNATVFTIFNSDSSFKLTIPSSVEENGKTYKVTEIGEYALENDKGTKGLTSVTIPSTVKKIGKEAFKGAKNLKTITIKGNVTSIGKNAFSGINSKATFKIKATKTNYNKIVSRIKKSGVAKTVKFQRIK
ncbi:MAG: leucine-rich repeat domain-containing protein, partial [Lachnospiraceae bacterium]